MEKDGQRQVSSGLGDPNRKGGRLAAELRSAGACHARTRENRCDASFNALWFSLHPVLRNNNFLTGKMQDDQPRTPVLIDCPVTLGVAVPSPSGFHRAELT